MNDRKFDLVVGQHELDAVSDVALSVATHTLQRHMHDDEGHSGPSTQLSREDLAQVRVHFVGAAARLRDKQCGLFSCNLTGPHFNLIVYSYRVHYSSEVGTPYFLKFTKSRARL